jgi:hypothetical protein
MGDIIKIKVFSKKDVVIDNKTYHNTSEILNDLPELGGGSIIEFIFDPDEEEDVSSQSL